jgi:hypothetical protein
MGPTPRILIGAVVGFFLLCLGGFAVLHPKQAIEFQFRHSMWTPYLSPLSTYTSPLFLLITRLMGSVIVLFAIIFMSEVIFNFDITTWRYIEDSYSSNVHVESGCKTAPKVPGR